MVTTRTGNPIEPRNLARSFARILKDTKLRPIRLHDLRRTTATCSSRSASRLATP